MLYEKNGQILEVADQFLYEENIFLSYPNRWELFRSKIYKSKNPIYKKNSRVHNEDHGCYILRYWELIAAPKHYLINKGFRRKL